MKNSMKSIALTIPLFCFALLITANQLPVQAATPAKVSVVTSLPLVKDIVENVGGTKVNVTSIVKGAHCDHEYEPSPKDMVALAHCAVFVKLGFSSDTWADKLAASAGGKKTLYIDASHGVKALSVNGLSNPHYWGSPDNVKVMAKNILTGLSSAAPRDKKYFTANYQRFVKEIDRTAASLRTKVAELPQRKLVSYSGAFPYFFTFFGFENLMTVETSCEQEVSPKALADAATLIKEQKVKILVGDAAEPKEPAGLAKETKTKVILLWATTDASGNYLKTLKRNVEMLVTALQ